MRTPGSSSFAQVGAGKAAAVRSGATRRAVLSFPVTGAEGKVPRET